MRLAVPAQAILDASGIKGGLVVCVGNGDGALAADLFSGESYVVHGLLDNRGDVAGARELVRRRDLYGKVSVQYWGGTHLPYADNMVNLLVIQDARCGIRTGEIARVLAPRGMAIGPAGASCIPRPASPGGNDYIAFRKPVPPDIDEWTHYLHGPDNNAVARDTVVGVPEHVQWIGHPKFARSHEQLASVSAMVSAKGRVFYIIDMGQTADIRMPARWHLVARDAFNGVVLWTRSIGTWTDHMHGFRSGPPDLPFRLVAAGDRVYVTAGEDEPVISLEAATGKALITYKGTEHTRQVIHVDPLLIMLAGTSQVAIRSNAPSDDSSHRSIIAANAETGRTVWRKKISVRTLLPLAVSGASLLYQTSDHLVCLELASGEERWRTAHPIHLPGPRSWSSPTLTAHNGILYVADFRSLSAISVEDGEILWKCSSQQGFCSPPDIFVMNGLLWRGYTGQRGRADFGQGLNARTGKLEKTIATDKAWQYATLAHYRCYRPKATSRYILSSRSGIEFINVESGRIDLNHWVRGTCQYGVMPCNGLVYAPPHSCACNIKTMFRGMCALAASSQTPSHGRPEGVRLERGDAYGQVTRPAGTGRSSDDWPVFRHDNERSGATMQSVPRRLRQVWRTRAGERLSSPVAARGRVYVSDIDAHTVHALDAAAGTPLWSFTADGRIDSPPTIGDGLVFFGSADGRVYSVRETDGALVWRFRAAPIDRCIVVRGQVESAWPVHGSVLLHKGTLVVAAGRSSYLDGGIHVYRLDPETGKQLSETVIHSPDPETGDQPPGGVDLRGVLNDILAVSGDSVYMRHLQVDFETGDDLKIGPPHLFAPTGFLDDSWWHRTYWIFGSDPVCMPPVNESGWQIWPRVGNMVPSGRILCMNRETIFGFGRDRYPGGHAGQIRGGEKYRLFAAEKKSLAPLPSYKDKQHLRGFRSGKRLGLKVSKRDRQHGAPSLHRHLWSEPTPILARALVLADTTLYLAGPPELDDMRRSAMALNDPDRAEAALLGQLGASLLVVDAVNGRQLAEYELESPPVFDGMIAAQGRLFVSLKDGSLACFGE
jgi:outer membrane protein assembly factor BamB